MSVTMEFKALLLQLLASAIICVTYADIEMKFTKSPESVTAPVGDKVTFECEVAVPGEKLSWRWKPLARPDESWHDVTGATEKHQTFTRLVVEVADDTPSGLYQCIVYYGSISLASVPARLTIARMNLSKNSGEKRVVSALVDNTVVLHCKEPYSEPPAILSWWKEIGTGQRISVDTPNGVLVIKNVETKDSGTYGCNATNEFTNQVIELPERTVLRVLESGPENLRFLESEDYVGTKDDRGILTVQVQQNSTLQLWCGIVGPAPLRVTWSSDAGAVSLEQGPLLTIPQFTSASEGTYTCAAKNLRRSWNVVALQAPRWEGSASSVNVSEGGSTYVSCGLPKGQPAPTVYWILNTQLLKNENGIKTTDSELYIERTEKRHAGIVQCFACNTLGCVYDAAMLTVVPIQISDQEYVPDVGKVVFPPAPPKRHNRKNTRKNKVMMQPSRPNVTRLSDTSVMVTWSNSNKGMPIQFFKVQYREAVNSSNPLWSTETAEIPPHIHSYQVNGLVPDRFYKFRIAAVYVDQNNQLGKSSAKFYLQSGDQFLKPAAPKLTKAVALSPYSIMLNWTWSSGGEGGVEAEGFYVYWRALSSAGEYEKVTAGGGARARAALLSHLQPDTAYELKVQAYTAQAPSDFHSILSAKTLRLANATETTTSRSVGEVREGRAPGALVTAGGALGAGAVLLLLAGTLLLCRRARRPHPAKEKVSPPEGGGGNGYISAKVPITITANPMHTESADGGVEMSFLHNNNCGNSGNSDETLSHSGKNTLTRQYV